MLPIKPRRSTIVSTLIAFLLGWSLLTLEKERIYLKSSFFSEDQGGVPPTLLEIQNENGARSFPPDCTWQCYLRQNQDLYDTIPWNKTQAIQHYQMQGFRQNRICACKVILLAGPHKAASTSLQSSAKIYSEMSNVQWYWLGKNRKTFASFVLSHEFHLQNLTTSVSASPRRRGRKTQGSMEVPFHILRREYQDEIQTKYNEGYNIIFGSETIDRVTAYSDNATLIDEIINLLPEKAIEYRDKHLTSLVVYRAPRSSHLKSLWVQLQDGSIRKNGPIMSFRELICASKQILKTKYQSIDSIALAKTLLQKGIKVQLIDLSSLSDERRVFSILGCDAMGLPCIFDEWTNQTIPIAIDEHEDKKIILENMTTTLNTGDKFKDRDELFDVSNEQLLQIDDAMNKYDCSQYEDILKYGEKLEFLYRTNLWKDNMMKCKNYDSLFSTKLQVIRSFREIMCSDDERITNITSVGL